MTPSQHKFTTVALAATLLLSLGACQRRDETAGSTVGQTESTTSTATGSGTSTMPGADAASAPASAASQ